MTVEIIIAGIAIAFFAAACYSVTGFGFALVATPLLTIAWDVKSAVVASVILSTFGLIPLLVEARAKVNVPRVAVLVIGSLPGIPLGILMLERLNADALTIFIAATVIAASLLLYFMPHLGGERDTPGARLTAGFASGVLGSSTSMGGPPVVLYLLGREREVAGFRGSVLGYFLPGNLLTLAAFASVGRITGDVLLLCLASAPAVLLGLLAGTRLRSRVPPEGFRSLVLIILIVTSFTILASTLRNG